VRSAPNDSLALTACAGFIVLALIIAAGCATPPGKTTDQPQPPEIRILQCPKLAVALTLDGKLDEPAWATAQELPFMVARNVRDTTELKEGGTGKILWDDENLYIAAVLEDSDVTNYSTQRDDHAYQKGDCLEIFLKFADDNRYLELYVTPNNIHSDFLHPSRGRIIFPAASSGGEAAAHWDCAMKSNVIIDGTLNKWRDRDRRWTVELAIPLADLGQVFERRLEAGTRILVALCRYNYSRYFESAEHSSTADLEHANFHLYEDYSTLEFAE
jgi:hypothetical protein